MVIESLKSVAIHQGDQINVSLCTEKRVFGGGNYAFYHVVQVWKDSKELHNKATKSFDRAMEYFKKVANGKEQDFIKSGSA